MLENDNTNIHQSTKEPKINLNMRVKESLRNKIKSQMDFDQKNPDDFFSEMFYEYLKKQACENGVADFSADVNELEICTKRILTLFQSFIEKSYISATTLSENFEEKLTTQKEQIEQSYEHILQNTNKDLARVQKEYNMISEQSQKLVVDSKSLREKAETLEIENSKNNELLSSYKSQIASLKESNEKLKQEVENSIGISVLEKKSIEFEKELLLIEKEYQNKLNDLNSKYNELQLKYIDSINTTKS